MDDNDRDFKKLWAAAVDEHKAGDTRDWVAYLGVSQSRFKSLWQRLRASELPDDAYIPQAIPPEYIYCVAFSGDQVFHSWIFAERQAEGVVKHARGHANFMFGHKDDLDPQRREFVEQEQRLQEWEDSVQAQMSSINKERRDIGMKQWVENRKLQRENEALRRQADNEE